MKLSLLLLFTIVPSLLAADANPVVNPADRKVAEIRRTIQTDPSSPQPHIDLASEYCRVARDTQDLSWLAKADAEAANALKLAPGNYDAQKLKARILLGRGETDAALKLASELNHKVPDDIAVWALLAEINSARGNNKEALVDAQWVLDLRPGSTLGFTEAARLREINGDPQGAIEFYDEARRRTSLNDAEERAWLLTQVARLTAKAGDRKKAAALFNEALSTDPGSGLAVAGLAELKASNAPEAAQP